MVRVPHIIILVIFFNSADEFPGGPHTVWINTGHRYIIYCHCVYLLCYSFVIRLPGSYNIADLQSKVVTNLLLLKILQVVDNNITNGIYCQ